MLIQKEIDDVLKNNKDLNFDTSKNEFYGKIWISNSDYYDVVISLNGYPDFFPDVYEVGNRIPWKMDRHIYPKSGGCCFTTTAKSQILLRTKIKSLQLFISHIVIPFFRNNSYYEIHGKYFTSEYSHGTFGILESYQDILKIDNNYKIVQTMYDYVNGDKLSIRDDCFCGSGVKLKKCFGGHHNIAYRNLRM